MKGIERKLNPIVTLLLAAILAAGFAACGGASSGSAPSGSASPEPAAATNPSGDEAIDLSQFTAVEVPACDYVADWMIPKFGVITKANNNTTIPANFSMNISGVTTSQLDGYKKVLTDNGMTRVGRTYKNDKVEISIGSAGVGTTKDSVLYVTIKPKG